MDIVEVFVEVDSKVACPVEVMNISMKSGIALVQGSKIPSPLVLRLSCAMRRA